ncbi:MAG TPA: MaoC family dehydratase [Anaerovoracaceae bacterium]|nr:MaoC family dehydratase [Anaerovoracaceae bacterium]
MILMESKGKVMEGKKIKDIKIGDSGEFEKTITESDVYLFSGITGDFNPIHINSVEASKTIFKGRLVHGILTSGLISTALGTRLPGVGTIYLSQDLKFMKPVYINDTIKATVEVKKILREKNIVIFRTICTNQHGDIVLEGQATVMPPL